MPGSLPGIPGDGSEGPDSPGVPWVGLLLSEGLEEGGELRSEGLELGIPPGGVDEVDGGAEDGGG